MKVSVIAWITLLVAACATPALAGTTPAVAPKPVLQLKPTPSPTPIPALYQVLRFQATTGRDDLRGDSDASADVWYQDGAKDHCTLKAQTDGGWPIGSLHTVDCHLARARTVDQLRKSWIWLSLQSHQSFGEDPDNWNVNAMELHAVQIGGSAAPGCVYRASGNPMFRLTGSAPKVNIMTFYHYC
jgi:hypothetical protein